MLVYYLQFMLVVVSIIFHMTSNDQVCTCEGDKIDGIGL